MSNDDDTPGVRALSRHLDANPGSVVRWLRRGMPRDFAGAAAWRATHAGQRVKAKPQSAPADTGEAAGSFTHWRTRRERAAALQAEVDLRERQGELVHVDQARRAIAARCTSAREVALSISPRLAPVLAAATNIDEIASILDAELRRFLHELAAAGDDLANHHRNDKEDSHESD